MILFKGIKIPGITGISLFPFVLVRDKNPSPVLLNHERIHIRQQRELLVIFFYLWYLLEWAIHYLQVRNFWQAYRLISFEKEAYAHEEDLTYLKRRGFFAFLSYL